MNTRCLVRASTRVKSFKSCALNLALDGSEDDKIVCLRKEQPCEKGLEVLKTHASILSEVPVDQDDTNVVESDDDIDAMR